jgi:hypothetical protein
MTSEQETCVICYESINEGWHCSQCRDGIVCFACLGCTLDEKCPVCRVDRQTHLNSIFENGYEDDEPEGQVVEEYMEHEDEYVDEITCIVDSSHGLATYFCEKCNIHLCTECDKETHMYALMRFHQRTEWW